MIKTTILKIIAAAALAVSMFAQTKVTISQDEKLKLLRLESAAARAQATLTNFVAQAQRAVQEMEQRSKEATAAYEKEVADLKSRHKLPSECKFDENQDPKCPDPKEVKK